MKKRSKYSKIYRGERRSPNGIKALQIMDKEYQRKKRLLLKDKYSEENRLYRLNNLKKIKAHRIVKSALKKGLLKRKPCKICYRKDTHAHHSDYNHPLKVEWLCPIHHKIRHLKINKNKTMPTKTKKGCKESG